MKLVVGLGNPDEKYAETRHNLGFSLVDVYVSSIKSKELWEDNKKLKSQIVKTNQLVIAKPQTYMNHSGIAVSLIAGFYKIPPEDIIVVHDDMDLPLGRIKVRLGGAAAGHHGVESIIGSLDTDKFIRVRLGIGNIKSQSSSHFNAEDFVLSEFHSNEKTEVKRILKTGIKALEMLLKEGLEKAQNQFN